MKTPTLIHAGENDERAPLAHSSTLYRGLRHDVHGPVESVIYPGEGHSLTTYEHRKAKMEWNVAWFDRLLGPTSVPSDEPTAATDSG